MPFCPKCGWEFVPEIKRCSECGVALVAALSRQPGSPREEPEVKVAEVANEVLAFMCRDMLSDNGIPCLTKATGVGIGGWASASLLPHYLYVRASDAARAIELLGDFAEDDPSISVKKSNS